MGYGESGMGIALAHARKQDLAPRRTGGRPARISRERILDEARRIPANELTMPKVAERLGVNAAALYYHFESRDALLAELSALLVNDFVLRPADSQHWRDWLLGTAEELFRFFLANPVALSVQDWSRLARLGLPLLDAVLGTLEGAGFEDREADYIWSVVSSYVYFQARAFNDMPEQVRKERERSIEAFAQRGGLVTPRTRAYYLKSLHEDTREFVADALRWMIAGLPSPGTTRSKP
jgi:AcrR family transcriptional regulator